MNSAKREIKCEQSYLKSVQILLSFAEHEGRSGYSSAETVKCFIKTTFLLVVIKRLKPLSEFERMAWETSLKS